MSESGPPPQPRFGIGWLLNYLRQIRRRRTFMREFGWSLPTLEAVSNIVDFVANRRLIEVGAGHGLWAFLLDKNGIDVTATDDFSWSDTEGESPGRLSAGFSVEMGRFFPVERLAAAEAVRKYGDRRAMLLCWPPPEKPMAYEALAAFLGDSLIYIGDRRATADDRFRYEIQANWEQVSVIPLPSWPGLQDAIFLYRRKAMPWQGRASGERPHPHRF